MSLKETVELSNGVHMPRFGLGVWQVPEGDTVIQSVKWALETGYIAVDTAAAYGNEEGVGKAIKASGLNREDVFITTKVANSNQGYENTLKAFDESLRKLDMDYIDLYLIHWPLAETFVETWQALEKLYKEKKVRAIGVCNFHQHHFEKLMETAEITPMVNQIELHPLLSQEPLREYCEAHNIVVEAYSPLGSGSLLENKHLKDIADQYGKSVAQIILRWDWQHGIVTIPKSVHQERIIENASIFDFELSTEDMAYIDSLNQNERVGWNPERFD